MNVLGPLPRTAPGIRHELVMAVRMTNLTRDILRRTTTASVVSNLCLGHFGVRVRRTALSTY